jgi:YVTN family beta-propeller protein
LYVLKKVLYALLLTPLVCLSQTDSVKIEDLNTIAFKILKVGERPDFIATDNDDAWIIDDHQNRIIKISPDRDRPLLIVHLKEACTAPIVYFNFIWVMSCTDECLYKIDHMSGKILAKLKTGMADRNGEMSLAAGDASIWLLSDSSGILLRIDPGKMTIQKTIKVKPNSYCAVFSNHSIWVSNYADNSVQQIDTRMNSVIATIHVGLNPRFLTAGGHFVYTLNQGDGTVSEIDAISDKLISTVDVNAVGEGGDIASDSSKVWVVSANPSRPLQIINTKTHKINLIYRQNANGHYPSKVDGAVRISGKYIWISGYYSKTVWVLKK